MKVCPDPGHGGHDSGATGHGILEKHPNLAVALEVAANLRRRGLEIILTRTDDSFVTLQGRTDRANQAGADLFVSVHHNAAPLLADGTPDPKPRGYEIFHQHAGDESRWMESRRCAKLIHDRYAARFPDLPSRGLKIKVHSNGREWYHVLRETTMPAILVEGAFLTNPQDAALVADPAFLALEAQAITDGILEWYGPRAVLGTPLLGPARATVTQAKEWARRRQAHDRFVAIAPAYWSYGLATGIRPEVAYAQAAKETAFGRYGGKVLPEMNNWAGIKTPAATGDQTKDHEAFAAPEEGVRAHYNHLCAYVGEPPVGVPHGRYHVVLRLPWAGTIRGVEELGTRWAPAEDYGRSIVNDYLAGLLATEEPAPAAVPREEYFAVMMRLIDAEDKLARIRQIVGEGG